MWYKLDENNKPVPFTISNDSNQELDGFYRNRVTAQETVFNLDGFRPIKEMVSTVFLGLNHGFRSHAPILWETMSFERSIEDDPNLHKWSEREFDRYSTYEEAVEGHKRIKKKIQQDFLRNSWKAVVPTILFLTLIITLSQIKGQ